MASSRIHQQIAFLKEIDRLKTVARRTSLVDRSRLENTAEHSWHLAVMAVVLAEHAPDEVDVMRAVRMALVHDLVEIDAGDTFAFDTTANADREDRERAAADRLFAILPAGDGAELRGLWDEFEAGTTADARFAVALDRFAGLLQNWAGGDGGSWREHAVTRAAVLRRMDPIRTATPNLWPFVIDVIASAEAAGFFGPDEV